MEKQPLDIDFTDEGEVVRKEEAPRPHLCETFKCQYKGWADDGTFLCFRRHMTSGELVWKYWDDPGWCPEFLWYKDSCKKGFDNAVREKQDKAHN